MRSGVRTAEQVVGRDLVARYVYISPDTASSSK
jgi:hypothetical protein